MRRPEEVARNVAVGRSFVPPVDIADVPRSKAGIYYQTDDDMNMPSEGDSTQR